MPGLDARSRSGLLHVPSWLLQGQENLTLCVSTGPWGDFRFTLDKVEKSLSSRSPGDRVQGDLAGHRKKKERECGRERKGEEDENETEDQRV